MNALQQAIYERLNNDPAIMAGLPGGVHHRVAPLKTVGRFVVFTENSVENETTLSGAVIQCTALYSVRVCEAGESIKAASDVFDLIDAALNQATLHVEGWTRATAWKLREEPGDYETPAGYYQYIEGVYSIVLT